MSDSSLRLGAFELLTAMDGEAGVFTARHIDLGTSAMIRLQPLPVGELPENLLRHHVRQTRILALLHHTGVLFPLGLGQVTAEIAERSAGLLPVHAAWSAFERCTGGRLPVAPAAGWPELRDLCLQILDVLALSHSREVIHGSLQPACLWRAQSRDPRPGLKLADFALGQVQNFTDDRSLPNGTHPSYLAPEVCGARWRDVGPTADLYSLGCLAWLLASGRELYAEHGSPEGIRQAQINEPLPGFRSYINSPGGFGGWLSLLLRKDPRDRFAQAADAREALLQLDKTRTRGSVVRSPAPHPPDCGDEDRHSQVELLGAGVALRGLREIPLVDRDEQRKAVWDALTRVRKSARGEAILIHGPAGHGKSRLTEWMVRRSWQLGAAEVIQVIHDSSTGPALGLHPMLARHYRCVGLNREDLAARLQAKLEAEGVSDAYEWDALAELIHPSPTGQERVRFEESKERYSIIRRVLERAARVRPVILWVEDVQWGRDALEFIGDLLDSQKLAGFPILVVMTARDEALLQCPDEGQILKGIVIRSDCSRLRVGALSAPDQRRLISDALAVAGPVVDLIEERTSGHPLFAVQIVNDWIDRRVLMPSSVGFQRAEGDETQLPDDIHSVWMKRVEKLLERLPVEDRQSGLACLHQAAALGLEVNSAEWAEACQRAGIQRSIQLLDEMLGQGLAFNRQGGWAFAHGIFRESLEAQSRQSNTWLHHHRACAAMLQPRQSRMAGYAARVAHHLEQAGELGSALEPLAAAVHELWKGGSVSGARIPLERRRALLERIERPHSDLAWGEQSHLQIQQDQFEGRYESALKWSAFAMQGVKKHGWTGLLPRILKDTGVVHYKKGDMSSATKFMRHARAHAEQVGDERLTAECTGRLGMVLRVTGDLDLADKCFQAASLIYRRLPDYRQSDEGQAVVGRALVAQQKGEIDRAERWFIKAVEILRDSGHQRGLATSVNGLAEVARLRDDYARAEALYRQVLGIHRALGSNLATVVQLNLALVQLQQRQFNRAQESLEPLVEVFEASGSKAWLGCVHVFLLPCMADLRDWDRWDHHLRTGKDLITGSGMADGDVAWPLEMAAEMAHAKGLENRAREAYEFALAQYEALGREEKVAELTQFLTTLPKA